MNARPPSQLIVWPVTSPHGDKQQLNLALADKQMDAIEQASIQSQCSIRFQRPPAGQEIPDARKSNR